MLRRVTRPGGSASTRIPVRPLFDLLESKLRPQPFFAGNVLRTSLVNLLMNARAPIIVLSAAAGYGKTTLLGQWTVRSRRPVAWVSVDELDNDPVVLLRYIATALDRVSPLDSAVLGALASPVASIDVTLALRLGSALESMKSAFILVLDDLHTLTNPQCLDAIDALVDHIPSGSQVALSGRRMPSRRLGALRARRLAVEIGPDELRMDENDARELLRTVDVQLPDADLGALVEHTEGWPGGLYLAALAIKSTIPGANTIRFRGDDRFVADYLRSELLLRLPLDEIRFLTRTAVLDRMSGPLCDTLLEARGSAAVLESLKDSNVFVVPLDRNRDRYRYHHLFRELLRAELERAEPDLVPVLLTRAADWCAANGEPAAAVAYAQRAGDGDRVARLVMAHGPLEYQRGHAVTIEAWLNWLDRHGALDRNPAIASLGAWFSAVRGHSDQAQRWADAAERGSRGNDTDDPTVEAWLALLRAARCDRGVAQMLADSQRAVGNFGRGSQWWSTAASVRGLSLLVSGDAPAADDLFADIVESALATGAWNVAALSLAERATMAIRRDDWVEAGALAEQADSVMRRSHMQEYPPNALVHVALARVAIHRHEESRVSGLLVSAQRLRPRLTHVLATLSVQVRLQLASAYLAIVDIAGARTMLREVDGLLRRGPDFGTLASDADDLRSRLKSARRVTPGASTLTTAELRLLPLLPTHLSFPEIGERLHISRHTVKSQVMSIYRKLDVTSRNSAVGRAGELGLL